MSLHREKNLDGERVDQKPHRYDDGYRVLIRVQTEEEAEALFRSGQAVSMRMKGLDGKINLVTPDGYL